MKVDGDSVVRLSDIAEVRKTYKAPATIAKVNGKNAVVIEVSKRTGENIIDTVGRIKDLIEKEKQYLPENLEVLYSSDESAGIIDMVTDLENNIFIAVLLVMLVVISSVGLRSALLISISIPSSFLAGILFLSLGGFTLNIVVLFSLILTVGMIVDDAIVVSEYADKIMHEGVPVQKAFIISAKRMFWPIVTSTLVKIVVFLPLLFWPGVIGQFMKYMPITAIVILASSLLFALLFQPTLGPMFGHKAIAKKAAIDHAGVDHVDLSRLEGFNKKYYDLLVKALDRPKLFVSSIIGSLVVVYSFFIIFGTGVEFFPSIEPENARISVISPGNLSVDERSQIMNQVESKLMNFLDEDVKVFYVKAGNFDSETNLPEDTIGSIFMEYKKWNERRKSKKIIADMKQELSQIPGIKIEFNENKPGPPPEKPIQLNIASRDLAKAGAAADKVLEFMKGNPGYIQTEDSRSKSSIEWHVVPDREKAARFGVDLNTLGSAIRMLSNGLKISEFRPDYAEDEVDILLRLPKEYRSISYLKDLKIVNIYGQSVPISNFVTIEPKTKLKKIKKVNQEKVISIKSDVKSGYLNDTQVKLLKQFIKDGGFDSDINFQFKGEDEDQAETANFLSKAFMLTLILMFTIMLIQFNNYYHTVIVMSAVFLSTVGVLLGLIITWQPFGIVMCGVGIIALGGIVLNNNILFVDTYQHLRRDGMEVREAIIRAGVQRLRPILLTAATAVLGLLPMVFGITFNLLELDVTVGAPSSQWWNQLAASIAGGLTFATILTLFFTPCLLLIGKRFDRKFE